MAMATAIASAAVAITAAIAGGVIGMVADTRQHRQARANAKMQEEQNEYNARLAEREANILEKQNQENIRRKREESKYLQSAQRALLGKSGAAMESGSPLAVLGQTAADEELKIQDMAYSGYRQGAQLTEQAKMFRYQGAVARANAPKTSDLHLKLGGRVWQMHGDVAQIVGNTAGKFAGK